MPSTRDVVSTPDGPCPIELFTPDDGAGPWPGVLLYPDAGGVRDTLRHMAAELADEGYAVALPDVYYRHGDWAPFDTATVFGDPPERARLMAMKDSLTPDVVAADAALMLEFLASRPDVSGERFATTGYCMGGTMSLLTAGRVPHRVAAAMSFHGGGLVTDDADSPHLLAERVDAAVYVAGARDDRSFTAEQAATLDDTLGAAGVTHTVEMYPAEHGFAVPDMPTYDEAAAQRHWEAARDFLAAHLPR